MTVTGTPRSPLTTSRSRTAFLSLALASALLFSAGCGKSGMPQPQDSSKNFTWETVDAEPAGKCLAFSGKLGGAYRYFDGIRLEIDALSGPEDCPGCPFVPSEVTELSPGEAGFNPKDGTIAFSYCPQPGKAYRWRLAGISVFNRLPHASMTDRLLVVTPE